MRRPFPSATDSRGPHTGSFVQQFLRLQNMLVHGGEYIIYERARLVYLGSMKSANCRKRLRHQFEISLSQASPPLPRS